MKFLLGCKRSLTEWVGNLTELELTKLLIGLSCAVLYALSMIFPTIGQWLLCGTLLVIGFVCFASVMLSKAGVTINKLKPIEDVFDTVLAKIKGEDSV